MELKELFNPEIIQKRVLELGEAISRDFQDKDIVAVCVLKGAAVFYADLIRALNIDMEMDFVRLSSYGNNQFSSGNVNFSVDMETSITDRHVLIIEDIIDTGLSISHLLRILKDRNPGSLNLCALIDKQERRQVQVQVDYTGFVLQEGFIVGYGLDYAQKYRNLPGIFQLAQDE